MLAIETYVESHYGNKKKLRQNENEKLGVKFLRFDESEIYYNLDGLIKTIEN